MRNAAIVIFLLISTLSSPTFAQNSSLFKKQPTLSVHFMLNDYKTARSINRTSLGQVLKNDSISKISEMAPGLTVAYFKGISDHVDFMASLGGSSPKYELKNGKQNKSARLLLEADANVNVKLLSDKYRVTPFLTAGVGASLYGVHYGAYIPMGIGVQFKLGEDAFLITSAQYRNGITDYANNHLNFSIGFGAPLAASKD